MQIGNALRSDHHESDPLWNNGMVNASLHGISVLEAEHVLANVWRRVEEYGADAPHMHFDFLRDGSISIRFTFADPAIAALILNGLDPSGIALPPSVSNRANRPPGRRRMPAARLTN